MTDFRKLLNIVSETTAGAVASVAQPLMTQERVKEEQDDQSSDAQTVIEYGNWENSALATGNKLKKTRKKTSKVVKSIYGDDQSFNKVEENIVKDIKRIVKGKDIQTRKGEEIKKSSDLAASGDTEGAMKHQKRYEKFYNLQNKGILEEDKPKVRKYTKERPNGTKMERWEVLDKDGKRVKEFDSKELAQKYLKANKFDLMYESDGSNNSNEQIEEVSLGDYQRKAAMSRAKAGMGATFAGSDEERAKQLATMKKREQGLDRARDRIAKKKAIAPLSPLSDEERLKLQDELKKLQSMFDPNYEYSDDHGFWSKQKDIASRIHSIEKRLGQDVSEGGKIAVDRKTGKVYEPEKEFDKLLKQHQPQFQGMAAIEKAQRTAKKSEPKKQGVAEGFPQSGESSGKAKQFNPTAKIQTKEMTLDQILSSVKGIPYVNNVIDDWDAKDYSWGVTKKVIEYAQYLQKNPQSVANLPPLVVIDGQLNDGAHRLSAINLLQKRMDPKNPLWKQVKLKVNFGTSTDVVSGQGVAEGLENLSYIGNCTDDDVIEHIFGDATNFAQAVEEHGDEFIIDDLVVKYDPETDVHSFYYKKKGVAEGSDNHSVGDIVQVNTHRMGTDTGRYGKFNIDKLSPTLIGIIDHNTGERLKFNRKTGRGIGTASALMIKQGVAEGLDPQLDQQAQEVAAKLITPKNIEKLNAMAHDSTIYSALDRYFEKHNIPETIYNRVAHIVFKALDDHGRRMTTDPRIKKQDVAEAGEVSQLHKAWDKALKTKPVSPQQQQRNKERWAKRQAEREQGVAESDEPGYIKYEQMKDKIASVLIKLYRQGKDAETIKQMGDRVAKHLGYNPQDSIYQDAWMSSFTDASLDGSLDQEPEDDYTDWRMRQGEMGKWEGVAEGILNEIGYSDELGNLSVPDSKVIASATQDGTISQKPVMRYEQGNTELYFFSDDDKISALVLIEDGNKLRAIKNFFGQAGQIFALINYIVSFKNRRLIITSDEPLTKEGFQWVAKLIKNPSGLKITDTDGHAIDIKALNDEWTKSKSAHGTESGNTGIIISESSAQWKNKLIENENRLMPHIYFEVTSKKSIVVEGSDKLQGTPVVSLKDFGDKDNKKNKYDQTVPKKLKKDDPRVTYHKDEKQGVAEGLMWDDTDSRLSIDDRMSIIESYYSSKYQILTEANDQEITDYFLSLTSMSARPTKNGKFLLVFLALMNNKIIQLSYPEEVTVLAKQGNEYTVKLKDGTKKQFPSKNIRDKLVAATFFFNNRESFDKFRNIMILKFDMRFDQYSDYVSEKGVAESPDGVSSSTKMFAEDDPCWDNYQQIGMKKKNGKKVPNCVPKEETNEAELSEEQLLTAKLKKELELLNKEKSKEISSKPADKEIQRKK